MYYTLCGTREQKAEQMARLIVLLDPFQWTYLEEYRAAGCC